MTSPVTDVIPANVALQGYYSDLLGTANDITAKISPTSSAGGIVDLTGLGSLNMYLSNQKIASQKIQLTKTPTVVSADATGVVFKVSGADIIAIMANFGATSVKFSLAGINSFAQVLGVGTITINDSP